MVRARLVMVHLRSGAMYMEDEIDHEALVSLDALSASVLKTF